MCNLSGGEILPDERLSRDLSAVKKGAPGNSRSRALRCTVMGMCQKKQRGQGDQSGVCKGQVGKNKFMEVARARACTAL